MFKLRDKIKLKVYGHWIDYCSRPGQEAEVIEVFPVIQSGSFKYKIRWKDGGTSHCAEDNMIFSSKFREGDTIEYPGGARSLVPAGGLCINEDDVILVSRRRLI